MFFTRLRTHAKWVFVLLAAAFAIGFAERITIYRIGLDGAQHLEAEAYDRRQLLLPLDAILLANNRSEKMLLHLGHNIFGKRHGRAAIQRRTMFGQAKLRDCIDFAR